MKVRFWLVLCLSLPLLPIVAEAVEPVELAALTNRYVADRDGLKLKAEAGQTSLRQWYTGGLEAIRKTAQDKGDLDTVVAVDEERGRPDRELTLQEKARLPLTVAQIRTRYDEAKAQLSV